MYTFAQQTTVLFPTAYPLRLMARDVMAYLGKACHVVSSIYLFNDVLKCVPFILVRYWKEQYELESLGKLVLSAIMDYVNLFSVYNGY